MRSIYKLPSHSSIFPHPSAASEQGLLCIGSNLNPENILLAYRFGIFPWYSEGQPILWWSPDPRMVLTPSDLKISKSMRNVINQKRFSISFDRDFETIISCCRMQPRKDQTGTWITADMQKAYVKLHKIGYAHSVEVWENENLAGGLYGIAIGKVFYGESMFHYSSNASKVGFIRLVQFLKQKGFYLVDCQQETRHLKSMGARAVKRDLFLDMLRKNIFENSLPESWNRWSD